MPRPYKNYAPDPEDERRRISLPLAYAIDMGHTEIRQIGRPLEPGRLVRIALAVRMGDAAAAKAMGIALPAYRRWLELNWEGYVAPRERKEPKRRERKQCA